MKVNFNKIPLSGGEIPNIEKAIKSGHLHGDGQFMKICESAIREISGANSALLTNSCTAALDMAALLCDLKEGDEFIVSTYTFVSSVNAFVLRGAKPVFCDINPNTLNIDETKIEALITDKTKVIVPVHYAGVGCEMDAINAIAKKHGIRVVEDAAQGFSAFYRGRHLGTVSDMGALSFHGTKNVICGEGGALLVNDPSLVERANFIREKGTNRIQFIEGKIDKYTWVDYGSSYIPSELIAAFLAAQLEITKPLTEKRVAAWHYYYNKLSALEKRGDISLAKIPAHCDTNAHIFFLTTADAATTKALAAHLKAREVAALSHYAPLHSCPMARKLGVPQVSLPIAEKLAQTMLRLPMYSDITHEEQDWVCAAIAEFFGAK